MNAYSVHAVWFEIVHTKMSKYNAIERSVYSLEHSNRSVARINIEYKRAR